MLGTKSSSRSTSLLLYGTSAHPGADVYCVIVPSKQPSGATMCAATQDCRIRPPAQNIIPMLTSTARVFQSENHSDSFPTPRRP